MKLENIRLMQEADKSFIVYHETNPFSRYHYHEEFELVLILKGRGKRIVGDHIDRFRKNDLVLVGPNLPHEWLCDREYYEHQNGFQGEGIVYQFLYDFLGQRFFEMPENYILNKLLKDSNRGIRFYGETKKQIIDIMLKSYKGDSIEKLYSLIEIFKLLAKTHNYQPLSSPGFIGTLFFKSNQPVQKAGEYIHQNFNREININELLQITNMSNTAFCMAFKKTFRMTFKEYLLNTRVGYACKLLTDDGMTIAQIAYSSGFENISNFNKQFKKIKGVTPSQFQSKLEDEQWDKVV